MQGENQVSQVSDLLTILNEIAPFDQAEKWDNVGLLVGNPMEQVSGIMIGLDPTEDLFDAAIQSGANTVITHHPLIFNPIKSLRTDQVAGRLINKALTAGLCVIGCHTNLDVVVGGVNEVFARRLNLQSATCLTCNDAGNGFGRIGRLTPALGPDEFLDRLLTVLQTSGLRITGTLPAEITTVAVCGGSGSDLAEEAYARGADVFVSAEIKHSTARWAEAAGFCIIDAGHFPTENLVVPALAASLTKTLTDRGMDLDIRTYESQQSPFRYILKHNNSLLYSPN